MNKNITKILLPFSRFLFSRILRVILAILFAITPTLSWSAIPSRISDFMTENMELNLQHIAKMDRMMSIYDPAIKVKDFIPLNMKASSDSRKVATVLLSHSLNKVFSSPKVRNNKFGHTAHGIVNGMGTDMAWAEASGLIHKVKLKAKGSVASITYKGYLRANLSYEAIDGRFDFEVSKTLTKNTLLVFNHVDDQNEISDNVGLRWTW